MSEDDMIDCEEALKRLFRFVDQDLDDHKHAEMETHLSRCKSCYSRVEFEKRLHQHLRGVGQEAPSEALRRRVKKLMGET